MFMNFSNSELSADLPVQLQRKRPPRSGCHNSAAKMQFRYATDWYCKTVKGLLCTVPPGLAAETATLPLELDRLSGMINYVQPLPSSAFHASPYRGPDYPMKTSR